jgi:DNA-binding MarR family transcriptional regulator
MNRLRTGPEEAPVHRDIVARLGHLTLGSRLKRIGEHLQADVTRLAERLDLAVPAAQFPLLAALAENGPTSIGALARVVGVRQPAITRAVVQLTAAGLVRVTPDPDDQRVRTASLTDAGRALVDRAARVLWPAIDDAVRALCADLEGPLLDQLTALEQGLARIPLDERAAALIPSGEKP